MSFASSNGCSNLPSLATGEANVESPSDVWNARAVDKLRDFFPLLGLTSFLMFEGEKLSNRVMDVVNI